MSKAVIIPGCSKDIGLKNEISVSPTEKKDGAIGLLSRFLRFESLKRSPESPVSTEPSVTYYGVYIPCEIKKGPDEEAIHVYEDKSQALELVKRYKSSRFKAFKSHQDAVSFALRGAEPTDTVDGNDNCLLGEKPYPFKAPSPQDMVALRKAIEAGLDGTVRDRVWDNPRYLVSSGNTPSILQEGSRYNALHIAAKAQNAEICNLILNTVGNPLFVQTLYGSDSEMEACKEFASILVDRYLNTPDKAMNETPLHFAAKFGCGEVVDLLTSFPQCNKEVVNKYGEQPKDIICKRCAKPSPEAASRITAMLRDKFYVPVFHSEDDSSAPTIGRAFTPQDPPEVKPDPLSPRYEIRAFAGPMPSIEAEAFRRRWKTPPRSQARAFRLRDVTKGLENYGRNLAEQMKVGWKEYWPFLDTFTDLRTPEGLVLLENYLKAKYESACSFAYTDSCAQSQFIDNISFTRLSLGNISQLSSTPIKDPLSPMTELCYALKSCKLSDSYKKTDPIRQRMCRQPIRMANHLAKPILTNGDVSTTNHTVSQLLCIERTCQVFAKRIADALNFSLTAELEVAGESLKSEAKHLQHTINTYMNDERFKAIDFSLTHSRLAQLVVSKLKQHTTDLDDINMLVDFLEKHSPVTYKGPNKIKITIDCHVKCLSSFISKELALESSKGPAVSELECIEIWQKAVGCNCDWQLEQFERNSKKNASFRKMRSLSTYSDKKGDGFVRRLSFDHDIGDGKQQSPERGERGEPSSVNSPAGDSALFTVDTDKCQAVAEISDDESSASDSEQFETASERSASAASMHDASDRALAEPFIYGEEPSKMDRLVWDAISDVDIDVEQYPNVARWRHTVALYTEQERNSWLPAPSTGDDSISSHNTSWCIASPAKPASSTPDRNLPLQVSTWLRVTGPNSPRSALAAKNVGHNVSFGF